MAKAFTSIGTIGTIASDASAAVDSISGAVSSIALSTSDDEVNNRPAAQQWTV